MDEYENPLGETIKYLKRRYDFKGPLHFTDFKNLKSIKDSGYIFSRNHCYENKIGFNDGADKEVINITEKYIQSFVRFYYKEKTMTSYISEGIKEDNKKPHISIPVYFLLDEDILYLDYTLFTNGNAASKKTLFGVDYNFFNNMDWHTIFHRGPINIADRLEKTEFKRRRQAELLSIEPISLNYVKKIIFRCNADYKRACNLFGYNELYKVDQNMFNNNNNYIIDYSLESYNFGGKKNLLLKFVTNKYVVNNDKHGYELIDINNRVLRRTPINYPKRSINQFNKNEYTLNIDTIPNKSFKFKFWFFGVLSIEEQIN